MDIKCFAITREEAALDQAYQLAKLDAFKDTKIRLMPDMHAGKGCVIGFTADLGDKVIPNIVGVDIGCGMLVCNIGQRELDLPALDKFIREHIPSGMTVNERGRDKVPFVKLKDLKMRKHLKHYDHLQASIGSLGGGNHFIEVDQDEAGNKYIVIHTGSRNLGQQVCRYYQELAVKQCNDRSEQVAQEIKAKVAELQEQGRNKEIADAITEIKQKYKAFEKIPADLCYLTGELREDYLHDMRLCQEFAHLNRAEILHRIKKHLKLKGRDILYEFETIHNYINFNDNIVRKGAISCREGEQVIIPLNMRDGSIVGRGKGNPDWNYSGPHGAGRIMSRAKAKESLGMDEFRASMSGIYTTSVSQDTIDESPMAYKPSEEIMEAIGDSVEIINIIKPIYNFKASE